MKSLRNDNRAKTLNVVIGLAVLALLAAFLTPVALNAMYDDDVQTLTQDNGTEYEVAADLNSTVTSVTVDTSAKIKLVSENETVTKTVSEGSESTFSFDSGDVVANLTDTTSATPNTATVRYDVPKDFAYGSAARSLWPLIGLAIILTLMLAALAQGLREV